MRTNDDHPVLVHLSKNKILKAIDYERFRLATPKRVATPRTAMIRILLLEALEAREKKRNRSSKRGTQ